MTLHYRAGVIYFDRLNLCLCYSGAMNLSKEQEKFLRKLAHSLDPVAWVGQNGLTDRVMEELV